MGVEPISSPSGDYHLKNDFLKKGVADGGQPISSPSGDYHLKNDFLKKGWLMGANPSHPLPGTTT
ncbi:hypothetical protein BECAL_02285 [Bellilinea caldifistulae]|uniref:Uncharacterized protein n=1 Tax=Bellilinea caldifistulae TaxID=360411 RepID=A0A0N8GLY9_9CHLR|nr:hypothetical protein AC812_13635 [Bellilinea caldifistulae]GAP11100.1 hypothetical protein BECAL_02285 [Bellilinea caldifistulae]